MILVLFFIIFSLIFFTYIRINFKDIYISNISNFKYNFQIKIGLYLFNKIKIFGITISKDKIKNNKMFTKIEAKMKNQKLDIPFSESKNAVKKAKINLDSFNAKIKIGTEDVILTSFIVAILSSSIGILLGKLIKKYKQDKYKYIILPYYDNKNIFDMELNCIISVKLVHIIYVIYMLSKKRSGSKYERTSNRRSYDYSYE